MSDVRVLHLNDCAFVGRNLVAAARRSGRRWDYLDPQATFPRVKPGASAPTRLENVRTLARLTAHVGRADVVHVHFATTVRRLRPAVIPDRPYVLHLHGTDIRSLWAAPETHADIQRCIDGASHVYYSTRDNRENAERAFPGAEYMPIFVDANSLPRWAPAPVRYVAFTSRWEDVKGLPDMLDLARQLRAALPADIQLQGLDWGPGAAAAKAAGVTLVPKMAHADFLAWLAGASAAVGQATPILAVSEIEAMGIGVPLAALGPHLPGPDGAPVPIRTGSTTAVVEAIRGDLDDPLQASRELGARAWVLREHTADRQVPRLLATYRAIAAAPAR